MQRSLRAAHTKSVHVSWLLALSLASLGACTAPRQFGRSSTTPMPGSLGNGQNLASRAPATLQVIRTALAESLRACAAGSGSGLLARECVHVLAREVVPLTDAVGAGAHVQHATVLAGA